MGNTSGMQMHAGGVDCYPLTVTNHASPYLLLCQALESVREEPAITASSSCSCNAASQAPSDPKMAHPAIAGHCD